MSKTQKTECNTTETTFINRYSLPDEDLTHVSDHVDWSELCGQHIFLTGGTGFFGKWLIETFLYANEKFNLGASMTVLTRNTLAFRKKMPNLSKNASLSFNENSVESFTFSGVNFSHIIHAAIPGTKRVLEFAKYCGAKKFLLTSSGAVYDQQANEYGQLKRSGEDLCIRYSRRHDIEAKIARCFSFVGPYLPLDKNFAIGNFIENALQADHIHVKGDGTTIRSYLYAADLAIWLWRILFFGIPRRPYDVGSDTQISIANLAHLVSLLVPETGVDIDGYILEEPRKTYIPDIRRTKEEIDVDVYVPLEESIKRTFLWYKARNDQGKRLHCKDSS